MASPLDGIEAVSLDFANTLYPLRAGELEKTIIRLHSFAQESLGKELSYRTLREAYLNVRARQFSENRTTLQENDFYERISLALASVMNGESPSDDFVRAGQDAYAIAFANAMVAPSGLSEIVKAISERFHGNVAVCSNFIRADSIRIPLERDGIAPYLKGAVVSCEIGFIKPHPLIFQATINLLQESPEKIVHVGDDWDADVIGASRSGLKSVYTTQWRDENDPWYGKISCPIAEISELTRFIAL